MPCFRVAGLPHPGFGFPAGIDLPRVPSVQDQALIHRIHQGGNRESMGTRRNREISDSTRSARTPNIEVMSTKDLHQARGMRVDAILPMFCESDVSVTCSTSTQPSTRMSSMKGAAMTVVSSTPVRMVGLGEKVLKVTRAVYP